MSSGWGPGAQAHSDELDQVVFLSNLIGAEERLVQPGGGNTSIKVTPPGSDEELLLVKGSGTDLRSVRRGGFTQLSMRRLAGLRREDRMTDAAMMEFMRACMLRPGSDPLPSVETPLHSILPHRVIAHTHDVATMSVTNIRDDVARDLLAEVSEGRIVYVPYARPGFPLALAVRETVSAIPEDAIGMALAHHGLVVWADDVRTCYERLIAEAERIEEFIARRKSPGPVLGAVRASPPPRSVREDRAVLLAPVIRGSLGVAERVVLDWDDSGPVLERLAAERFGELSQRGMATPEHILRAGRLPVWLPLDLDAPAEKLVERARAGLTRARREYERYHARLAGPDGPPPLDDWAKVVLVPGVGMFTAFRDKAGARTANACYRSAMQAIENAEMLGGFRFLPATDVFEFEHWPLERRKVKETAARERRTLLLTRRVAVVVGAASGIGEAAVRRFAEEGAHVVAADLDEERVRKVVESVQADFPERVLARRVDVRDGDDIAALLRAAVLAFGGVDTLFYTAGAAPRFAPLTEIAAQDLISQVEVHYLGAVLSMREAARIMTRQGTGGSIVCSVSKAALSPGRNALAYSGSKAALQHALRVAALELGPQGVRVNAINADQVDTPLFRRFAEARARSSGQSLDDQLRDYRERNAMGVSLIPPKAVADAAVLLASDRFRYTTGDVITVDGGLPDAFPR